MAVVFSEIKFN